MLQPLVVGLGRSGAGLHAQVLATLLSRGEVTGPVLACDERAGIGPTPEHVRLVTGPEEAARLVDPRRTVVHVCTPPQVRLRVLTALADLGFRNILVEKPLATGEPELAGILRLHARHGLRIAVVAHWLAAELTRRLAERVRDRSLGELQAVRVEQHKPRFLRSLRDRGHPTAFDVEIPHSLGVVLHLAGPAELVSASCADMCCGEVVVPRMGDARLALRHHTGVRTEIHSDLTSPVRRRSIRLEFEAGTLTGHYPLSDADDHAQLVEAGGGAADHAVFRDDALLTFLRRTYRAFAAGGTGEDDLALHAGVVRLLAQAKTRCGAHDETGGDHAA